MAWINNHIHIKLWAVISHPGPRFNGGFLNHTSLQWRHNEHDGVSNHQPHDYLLDRLFRRRSKKTSKLRVTGLCVGNSPVTGEFPAQRASNTENVSIWWRHHAEMTGLSEYILLKKDGRQHLSMLSFPVFLYFWNCEYFLDCKVVYSLNI